MKKYRLYPFPLKGREHLKQTTYREGMNYFQMVGFNGEKSLKQLMGNTSFGSLRMIDKKVLFKRHVEVVNLELSYECNRKCDYYPVSFSDRQNTQSYMDKDLIEKICIELSEIRYDNSVSP